MQSLKKSERILLGIFISMLFVAATWVAWNIYSAKRVELEDAAHLLSIQEAEVEVLLRQKDLWLQRANWLQAAQPKFTSWDEADIQLLQDARAAGDTGVTTTDHQLLDPVETELYRQAGVRFKAEGSLTSVFAWLYKLQSPEKFRVISKLRVAPDKEDTKKVNCEVELLRWYRVGDDLAASD